MALCNYCDKDKEVTMRCTDSKNYPDGRTVTICSDCFKWRVGL